MNKMPLKIYFKKYLDPIFPTLASSTLLNDYPELKALIGSVDNAPVLDLMYLTHSGDKGVSPLLDTLYISSSTPNKEARTMMLLKTLIIKYGYNWNKIAKAYALEYNPISNYDMTEHEEVNSKIESSSGTKGKQYGFNSPSAVPSNDVDTESETHGLKDDNFRDLTRSGNIGVTTSQQMLQSELELRRFNILENIFNDMDKELCLKIY